MKVTIEEIINGLFHTDFPTQYELTSTFLRFQEFYESPKFRHKIFTLEEFMDWYAQKNGNFTYYKDYTGFNIPADVLHPFNNGDFNPLSEKEKWFLDLFAERLKKNEEFYIIGTFQNNKEDLEHEIAHGLYYLDKDYKTKVNKILSKMNFKKMHNFLKKEGYHKTTWTDEVQAYLISGYNNHKYTRARKQIRKIFKRKIKKEKRKN